MSTPNPFLVAGAPELIAALQAVQTAVTTITTGDPMTVGIRATGALAVLRGQLILIFPQFATAELGTVGTDINGEISGLIGKINVAAGKPAAAQTP